MGGTHLRSKGHALCASRLAVHSGYPVLIYKRHDKEGGVFAAKLTFVSPMYLLHSARDAIPHQRVSDDSLLLAIFLLDFGQPSDYPLSPFKMKFEPPIFHPNGDAASLRGAHGSLLNCFPSLSLPRRYRVYLHSAYARRRSHTLRASIGTLEPCAVCRESYSQCHINAGW